MIWSILRALSRARTHTQKRGGHARREAGLVLAQVVREPAGDEDVHHGRDREAHREDPLAARRQRRREREGKGTHVDLGRKVLVVLELDHLGRRDCGRLG